MKVLFRVDIDPSFSLYSKKIFLQFFCRGDRFYSRYMNTTDILKYLDGDGTGVKPKQSYKEY